MRIVMSLMMELGSMQRANADFLQGGEYGFAELNNLEHCIKYLNQTLVVYGFPSPLNLLSKEPASVVETCNCLYAILQQRQRDIEFRETANDQRQRHLSDMSRLESKVERLEAQISSKEKELVMVMSREQKTLAAFKQQTDKLQQERDEFQRMLIGSQQIRTQQLHELKKKEKEYMKLQERLNQIVMEKKKESKAGMEIMNVLHQKDGRQRGTWNGRKGDGEFYKMIVEAYESKKRELMAENSDLRALLRSMQTDMRNFLNIPTHLVKNCGDVVVDSPPATPLKGGTDVFDLPFHMARDQIEQSLRSKMCSIKERMEQLQEAQKGAEVTCEASDRELELEAQLVEARSIIQEQACIMKKHLCKSGDGYEKDS